MEAYWDFFFFCRSTRILIHSRTHLCIFKNIRHVKTSALKVNRMEGKNGFVQLAVHANALFVVAIHPRVLT